MSVFKCLKEVRCKKEPCKKKECRHWIDFSKDLNCVLEAVESNNDSSMTLREIAKRLSVSFVRVKQIEDIALKKICENNSDLFEYLLKDDF